MLDSATCAALVQPPDSAACGLSTPTLTSTMMTMPSAMRYQTNGMKLLVEMNFMNELMTTLTEWTCRVAEGDLTPRLSQNRA